MLISTMKNCAKRRWRHEDEWHGREVEGAVIVQANTYILFIFFSTYVLTNRSWFLIISYRKVVRMLKRFRSRITKDAWIGARKTRPKIYCIAPQTVKNRLLPTRLTTSLILQFVEDKNNFSKKTNRHLQATRPSAFCRRLQKLSWILSVLGAAPPGKNIGLLALVIGKVCRSSKIWPRKGQPKRGKICGTKFLDSYILINVLYIDREYLNSAQAEEQKISASF